MHLDDTHPSGYQSRMYRYEDSNRFRQYLFTGERILWTGQPRQGLLLSSRDALLIPFSFLWGGFAIFWNAMVWFAPFDWTNGDSSPWFFRVWGLPFLVIGLYLMVGRFFHDAAIRKHLFYAVTDQRALVLRGSKITSLDIHRLPRLELSEHRDGTGTLAFEASNLGPWGNGMNGFSWWLPALGNAAQFFRIQDPRKVYELVRNQERAQASTA
jgi:hypothetical protein